MDVLDVGPDLDVIPRDQRLGERRQHFVFDASFDRFVEKPMERRHAIEGFAVFRVGWGSFQLRLERAREPGSRSVHLGVAACFGRRRVRWEIATQHQNADRAVSEGQRHTEKVDVVDGYALSLTGVNRSIDRRAKLR